MKARLCCNVTKDADAPDNPTVEWYKGNTLVSAANSKRVLIDTSIDTASQMMQSLLQIDPVSYTDHGDYTCRAYYDLGFYTESRTLLIVECTCVSGVMHANNLVLYRCPSG